MMVSSLQLDDFGDSVVWQESSIETLPPEILLHVFRFLEVGSLFNVKVICKLWCAVASEYELWTSQLHRLGDNTSHVKENNSTPLMKRVKFLQSIQKGWDEMTCIASNVLFSPSLSQQQEERRSFLIQEKEEIFFRSFSNAENTQALGDSAISIEKMVVTDRSLIAQCGDHLLKGWDLTTGHCIGNLHYPLKERSFWIANEKWVAIYNGSNEVRLFQAGNFTRLYSFRTSAVFEGCFADDFLVLSTEQGIQAFDLANARLLNIHDHASYFLHLFPYQNTLIASYTTGIAIIPLQPAEGDQLNHWIKASFPLIWQIQEKHVVYYDSVKEKGYIFDLTLNQALYAFIIPIQEDFFEMHVHYEAPFLFTFTKKNASLWDLRPCLMASETYQEEPSLISSTNLEEYLFLEAPQIFSKDQHSLTVWGRNDEVQPRGNLLQIFFTKA